MPKPNERIGPYQLIRKLGKGAFGEVWLAQDVDNLVNTAPVALKLPLNDDIDLDAIRQEAAVWVAASGHPNILPMLEARRYDGHVIIASEYASDGSLQQWLKANGGKAPTVEAALMMTRDILAGLGHLHSRRIIHRDLKPDNILLNGTTPRIADFGISRVLKSTSLSMAMAGTPVYMAPEAFRRKRNEQTDLWSVSVLLYQMLSGRLPFIGADLPEVMYAITNEEPAPLPANLPDWVRQVVKIALTKNSAERFKTAEEMGAALAEPHVTPSPKIQTTHLVPTLPVDVTTVERPHPIALKAALPDRIVLPRSFVEDLNGVPLELILVPSGKFLMGSPKGKGYDTEQPQHEVTVSAFYCGKFPVTQMQWQAVMDNNPSHFKGDLQCPVEMVKWEHAKAFCAHLRELTGKHYRLPSESEWEYACRASTTGDYAGKLEEMAWYNKNASDRTHPVGQKKANKFGLYDMHGNVWEWCEDAWHANYQGAPTDGSVWWQSGNPSFRVSRGGSWGYDGTGARSANRVGFVSDDRNFVGLRVVMSTKTS